MLLRRALPEDAMAVAEVHVRSWQLAYRGLLPDSYLDALSVQERASAYAFNDPATAEPATIIAVQAQRVYGFATTGPSRDRDRAGSGELCALYVDPERWGSGVGSALIEAARASLLAQGFEHANLWVLVGNERAKRFYRRDGWLADGHRRCELLRAGVRAWELRYSRALT